MRPTGFVRKLDQLGRISIPMELRRNFDIHTGNELEMYVNNDKILLDKHIPSCVFCDSVKDVAIYKEKIICHSCLNELRK